MKLIGLKDMDTVQLCSWPKPERENEKEKKEKEVKGMCLDFSLGKDSVLRPVPSISISEKSETGVQRIPFILLDTHDPLSFSSSSSLTHADTFSFND